MNRLRSMIKNFRKVLLYGLPLFLLTACAGHHKPSEGHDTKDTVKIMKDSVTLKPSGMYEECFELGKGQKLHYKFDANRPVDFNVHFHAEDGIHNPVQQNDVTSYDGTIDPEDKRFQAGDQESYCLMWENPDMRPVRVSYECIVKGK